MRDNNNTNDAATIDTNNATSIEEAIQEAVEQAREDLLWQTGRRLQVRKVNVEEAIRWTVRRSRELNRPLVKVFDGGDVANRYGWPADTECLLVAVAADSEKIKAWAARAPANKVSSGGAAEACLSGARPAFDGRYTPSNKEKARQYILSYLDEE